MEPIKIGDVLREIAKIKGMDEKELEDVIERNLTRFLRM